MLIRNFQTLKILLSKLARCNQIKRFIPSITPPNILAIYNTEQLPFILVVGFGTSSDKPSSTVIAAHSRSKTTFNQLEETLLF